MPDEHAVFQGQIFEWDRNKAQENVTKHGVTFEEAASAFADPFGQLFEDLEHSWDEERIILIGESAYRRILMVVSADRAARVRLISARIAEAAERGAYERAKFEHGSKQL